MTKRFKYFSFLLLSTFYNVWGKEIYSISVCTTTTLEGANNCKAGILRTSNSEVFILPNENGRGYSTYLGKFSSYLDAKSALLKTSFFVKQQKPFVKQIDYLSTNSNNTTSQNINQNPKDSLEFTKYLEEMKKLNYLDEVNLSSKIGDFENLIITVDSENNIMQLKGKDNNGKISLLKIYRVSTAKSTIKKPLGEGNITSISLNPEWHPTLKTIKAFKQKGIKLPSIIPFGHKFNYMGAAKISLTHRVNGQEIYRIHGTLNESTIGTYESGGCIRMKNKEVFELATLLNQYANIKNLNSIKVILF